MDVVLEKLQVHDLELVRKWRNSEEVSKYMYTSNYITEEDQINWFQAINWEKNHYWLIKYGEKKMGVASINGIDKTLQSCYWAFYLGDHSVRGQGIGSKVEFNVIDFVFNTLSLNKLRCEVLQSNEKVIKMHESFGFRREAYYREHLIKNGENHDVVGLALLKTEWSIVEGFIRKRIYG